MPAQTSAKPLCVVVAGPNGAGKSSVAPFLVGDLSGIGRYVNPDVLAAGMSGFTPAIADRRAGRIALETIAGYVADRIDFAFETTLSGRRWPRFLQMLERGGFNTILYYLWLPSPDIAVERVRYRVARGGHDIPEGDVRRRYAASVRNLQSTWLPRVGTWHILDASRLPTLAWVATGATDSRQIVFDWRAWSIITGEPMKHDEVREVPPDWPTASGDRVPSLDAILAAVNRGVRRELAIHKALGVPAVTWRDGKVVIVPPEELPALNDP
jgi:predicted ABC-type ATPase